MYVNRKIKNATETIIDGIKFRSKLDANCYKSLKESSLDFSYESEKLVLQEEFEPINITVFSENKKAKDELVQLSGKLRPITYTPDFTINLDPVVVYVEAKGWRNDVYPLKKKLILHYLNSKNDDKIYIFVEVKNIRQINNLITYLEKKYGK